MASDPIADPPPSQMQQPPPRRSQPRSGVAPGSPDPSPNADLLRKAVVSLERKLQERGAQLAEAQAAQERLEAEQGRWVRGAAELEAATAEAAALREQLDASQAQLRQLRHHTGGLEDSCTRLQEQVGATASSSSWHRTWRRASLDALCPTCTSIASWAALQGSGIMLAMARFRTSLSLGTSLF